MSAADFARQIDAELEVAYREIGEQIGKIGIEAATEIVNRTPVLSGKARRNWMTTVGGKTGATTEATDPTGGAAIGDARTAVANYGADGKFPPITVQNNLPYIGKLENGYSKQAPSGMVAVTLAGLQARYG